LPPPHAAQSLLPEQKGCRGRTYDDADAPSKATGCAIPSFFLSQLPKDEERSGEERRFRPSAGAAVLVSPLSKMSSPSKRREMDLMKL